MYVYIYIFIYIFIYLYIYIFIYISTTYTRPTRKNAVADKHIYIYIYIFIYVYICIFMEDAMRRDTATPSVLGLGVFVIRFAMWRLAVYAWRSFY